MPSREEIKALVERMPELDAPPPPPPPPEPKPAEPAPGAEGGKTARAPKPQPARPRVPDHAQAKGKLTGPVWPDAEKTYDAILAGGKEAVATVIDLITEKDVGPAYKPRYVLYGMAVYACRPGKEKERATITQAIVPELTGGRPTTIRAFLVRTLQATADPTAAGALGPLLTDADLADPAAQAMVSLGGESSKLLRDALPQANGRAKLAVVQALGMLRDAAAIDALGQVAANPADENTHVTAIWSLARTGDARAIAPVLKATDASGSWPRAQAVKAAFVLAESLATRGKKADAAKVYQHLHDTRTAPSEKHIREAAARGLEGVK